MNPALIVAASVVIVLLGTAVAVHAMKRKRARGTPGLVATGRNAVIEQARHAVVVTDPEGRIVDANPAAVSASGRPRLEVIGHAVTAAFPRWAELAAREPGMPDAPTEVFAGAADGHGELTLTVIPIRDSLGNLTGRAFVSDDMKALGAVRRELNLRTRELDAAYRDLEAFTHSVSHDLRAPLRAIEGFSGLLVRRQQGKLDSEGEEHLRLLGEGTRLLRQLFENLLEFSRLGKQPLRRRTVDVDELVRAVIEEFAEEIRKRSVVVEIGTLPPAVGDPLLLREMFRSLVGNALKFSRSASPAGIALGAEPEVPPVYFVRDNGVGFDMREKDRLFRVFQRLHDSEAFEGSGVGLAIAASIVQRHGGRIWAESTPGEGATFRLTLSAGGEGSG